MTNTMDAPADPAWPQDEELLAIVSGYAPALLIRGALRLGLPERIGATGPVSVAALARDLPAEPGVLRRVLRALAALGVLDEAEPDMFALTARGQRLRPGTPGTVHGVATVMLDDVWVGAWSGFEHMVRTGESAFEHVHGTDYMTLTGWSEGSPTRTMVDDDMAEHTRMVASAFLASVELSRFRSLVDVGGGSGTLAAQVLAAHPAMRGIVLDRADGLVGAEQVLAAAGVAGRCEVHDGDFFAEVPPGDLLLCKSVVFNWGDDDLVATLLANCRRALEPDGRLFLFEQMLPATVDGSMPADVYVGDVDAAVVLSGRLRTEPEYRALLARAGFAYVVHPLTGVPSGFCVLECAPRP